MNSKIPDPPKSADRLAGGPLTQALNQSEHVQGKVERAAGDLGCINAILKHEVRPEGPVAVLERALHQGEAVEQAVQESADELAVINDALAEEIDQRHELERRLSERDEALTESKVRERRSRHDALHDAATRLPNMTLFSDRIGNALAQAERHTRRLAVLFLDLDNFKNINDTYGHDVGDRVLLNVAQRLETSLRGGDTVSRRGGDEFLMLMLDVNDQSDAAGSAARILKSVAEPCTIDGVTLTVTASIGVAMYPEDGRSAEGLMKHADVAMYAAKKQRTGVLLYSELGAL